MKRIIIDGEGRSRLRYGEISDGDSWEYPLLNPGGLGSCMVAFDELGDGITFLGTDINGWPAEDREGDHGIQDPNSPTASEWRRVLKEHFQDWLKDQPPLPPI